MATKSATSAESAGGVPTASKSKSTLSLHMFEGTREDWLLTDAAMSPVISNAKPKALAAE